MQGGGSVKAATKATSKESSNTPIRTVKLRLIEKANISKDQTEAPGPTGEHRAVHAQSAVKAHKLGNQRTNQEEPGAETKAAAQSRE
jgi:hypothetical protein